MCVIKKFHYGKEVRFCRYNQHRYGDQGTTLAERSGNIYSLWRTGYQFTNEIALWARKKGYNGIIAPGARGTKDYENIILFNQDYIDKVLQGRIPQKIKK